MAKSSGLGHRLFVGGYNLSGDIGSLGKIGGGPAVFENTGIDKSAMERIGGLRDGGIDFTAFFNPGPALDAAHLRLSTLPTADVIETYGAGTAIGDWAACMVAKQIGYDGKRGSDGQFTFEVSSVADGFGIEWGQQLTAGIRSDTTATNGPGLDNTFSNTPTSTAFGLQAYLQVFSFTGTSATIKLQDSPDNATFTDITGGTFGAQTGIGASRIATAPNLAVARYLRVATTGTFTACTFNVVVVRNLIIPPAF